jgi:hypothetical protein
VCDLAGSNRPPCGQAVQGSRTIAR